jgi:AraC-like DNA-binding protein/quercetin dioxygenase-like cupin family protein
LGVLEGDVSSTGIDVGTSRSRELGFGAFTVSEVEFAAGRRLRWHEHPRACIAVVVEGTVRKRFAHRAEELGQGAVILMPALEPHEDLFGDDGARLVVVESEDGVKALSCFRDWEATLLAFRIGRELGEPDPFTPLAVEGLALELTVAAARGPTARPTARWLDRARELLGDRFLSPPTACELGAAVGVHPSHLARAFRAEYGESLGGYTRRLRLDWAATRLAQTDEPLHRIALDAGFVDQSHFTRAFRARFGLTPARYRAAHR